MKKYGLILAVLALVGCSEYVDGFWLKAVGTGTRIWVGHFKTNQACLDAMAASTPVRFVDGYAASDEEEHGAGLVLICVPGNKLIKN